MTSVLCCPDTEVVAYLREKIRFWVSLNGDQRPTSGEYYEIMVGLLEIAQDIPMSHIPIDDREATFTASFALAYVEVRFPISS